MRNLILCLVLAGSATTARGDSTATPADAHTRETTTSRSWQVGARAGVAVPRADLDPGILVGGVGRLVIDSRRMLTVDVGLDWTRLGHSGRTLLSPPSFPRSLGELDQQTDLVTIAAGASIRVAELGSVAVVAGAAVGVQLSRTRFHAYTMEAVRTRVAPAATVELSVLGAAGPLHWRATVAWRESRGAAGDDYGEAVTSGLLALAGIDW